MIKVKGASLNLDDDDQREMFEFLDKKTNCSNYLKILVQRDMENRKNKNIIEKKNLDFNPNDFC